MVSRRRENFRRDLVTCMAHDVSKLVFSSGEDNNLVIFSRFDGVSDLRRRHNHYFILLWAEYDEIVAVDAAKNEF